jgi:hypothetical protein
MMTNDELIRWRRQAQRRIREVLAQRRGEATPAVLTRGTRPDTTERRSG